MYYYKTHYISVNLNKYKQTEITGMLNRPECGWYQLYSYRLTPNTSLTQDELYLETTDSNGYEYRLALLEFNLADYAASKLDDTALDNIKTVLKQFSLTKAKMIIRFLYDWDGKGEENEPDNISYIKKHMTQAGKLLNKYKDYIYTTQGIFVGSWAEMHSSKYLSDSDMTTLLLHYACATDSSIYLSVRTPKQYRTIFKELKKNPEKYKQYNISETELKKRLGLFNDGLLGSLSDVGTYPEADWATTEKEKLAIRKSELDFQSKLSYNIPLGGEVVNDNPLNDGAAAIADLSKMHISYLNQMYDDKVIDKWKNSFFDDMDSIYNGYTIYDYFTEHMGARYVFRDCSLSYEPFQKGNATGNVTIENIGFSNLYHDKEFMLSLVNTVTKQSFPLLSSDNDIKADVCQWNAGEKITIPFSFSPFDFEDGAYYLTVRLTDSVTEETISFANDSFDSSLQSYLLGEITIKR